MKDVFYGLLSVILFVTIFGLINADKQFQEPEHNGGVVVEKNDNPILGYVMHIKYDEDNVEFELVYQCFYERYEVNDTIKSLKLHKEDKSYLYKEIE